MQDACFDGCSAGTGAGAGPTHTWLTAKDVAPARFIETACHRLRFLVRKFREDAGGERILVRASKKPFTTAQILDLHRALRRYGPAVLLHVTEVGDSGHANAVEWIDDGLMVAGIRRLGRTPDERWDIAFDDWLSICREAFTLHDQANGPSRPVSGQHGSGHAALMRAFASIGESAEFALVQRHFGAEPPGLLRFASAGLDELMTALAADFAGLGDPTQTDLPVQPDDEFAIVDRRYGLFTPTGTKSSDVERYHFSAVMCQRQQLLVDRFREDAGGKRIMLRIDRAPVSIDQIRALHQALRRYGPTMLLHVSERNEPTNTIERIDDGLLVARIRTREQPPDGTWTLAFETCRALCHRAVGMLKQNL